MKNNTLMTWIRLAMLAAVSLAPAMACSYSGAAASALVPSNGGFAQISINTQPGCVWQLSSLNPWVSFVTSSGVGAGIAQVSVAANAGSQRTATIQGYGSAGTCDGADATSGSDCSGTAVIGFQISIIQQ